MSKQITPRELAEIVTKLLTDPNEIDDHATYQRFFTGLAEFVCDYCGGEVRGQADTWLGGWLVGIHRNDSLPPSGGIWKDYDLEGEL